MHNYDKLYERLLNCKWFEKCGNKEECFDGFKYIWAKNLTDVEKNINSTKWENTCIEEDNELREFLQLNYPELRVLRNEQIDIINKKYLPEIFNKIQDAVVRYSLSESVKVDVQCIVRIIFICDFYSEQYRSEFYEKLLEIYLSGHLPCGYKGRFQEGSIIIY